MERAKPLAAARSIPACAGEPHGSKLRPPSGTVYPRVCGGTYGEAWQAELAAGLSPRVRGNLDGDVDDTRADGSIPACAGEPAAGR